MHCSACHSRNAGTGEHSLMTLEQAALLSGKPEVRFAAVMHDLGKAATPREHWPKHADHESRSVELLRQMCRRLGVPNRFRDLAIHVARLHGLSHRAGELRPKTILKMLEEVDAFRRRGRFEDFLAACEADARGRKGMEAQDYPQAAWLRAALDAAIAAAVPDNADGLKGAAFGDAIRTARTEAIARSKKSFR